MLELCLAVTKLSGMIISRKEGLRTNSPLEQILFVFLIFAAMLTHLLINLAVIGRWTNQLQNMDS